MARSAAQLQATLDKLYATADYLAGQVVTAYTIGDKSAALKKQEDNQREIDRLEGELAALLANRSRVGFRVATVRRPT